MAIFQLQQKCFASLSPSSTTWAPAPVTSLNGARGRRGIVVVVFVVVVSPVTVHHTHCAPAEAARLPCLASSSCLHITYALCVYLFLFQSPSYSPPHCHCSILPQRRATIYIYQRRHRLRRRLRCRMPHFVKRRGTDWNSRITRNGFLLSTIAFWWQF